MNNENIKKVKSMERKSLIIGIILFSILFICIGYLFTLHIDTDSSILNLLDEDSENISEDINETMNETQDTKDIEEIKEPIDEQETNESIKKNESIEIAKFEDTTENEIGSEINEIVENAEENAENENIEEKNLNIEKIPEKIKEDAGYDVIVKSSTLPLP